MIYLTYHRIVDDEREISSDYDIPFSELKKHLQFVHNSSLNNIRFTFDDGNFSDLKVAEELTKYGLSGTFFIITGNIGCSKFLTQTDIKYIHKLGHTIGSHSDTHLSFQKLSDTATLEELKYSKNKLEEILGVPVEDFAFPGGKFFKKHIDFAKSMGYENISTSDELPFHAYGSSRMHVRMSNITKFQAIVEKNFSYYCVRAMRTFEEAFSHSIVETITSTAHATDKAMYFQKPSVFSAGIL